MEELQEEKFTIFLSDEPGVKTYQSMAEKVHAEKTIGFRCDSVFTIISMISADSFKVYLTGGATWDMMIDNDYSKNKTLLPDFGLGVIQKASYRVVPFSKSKDTREIKRVIIEDQQVKN